MEIVQSVGVSESMPTMGGAHVGPCLVVIFGASGDLTKRS